ATVFASNRNCSERPHPVHLHTACLRQFRGPAGLATAAAPTDTGPLAFHARLARQWNERGRSLTLSRAPPEMPPLHGPAFRDVFRKTQRLHA
ncbi:MAG: hypothetical protein AAGJ53_07060, partial [Pseudomonadota bacterium]